MLGDMCRSYESAFSLADAWIFVQVSGLKDTYFAEALDAVKEDVYKRQGSYKSSPSMR